MLAACGGTNDQANTTGEMSVRLTGNATAISNGQIVAKATSENLLDLNRSWGTWSGDTSGVTYNAESGTLSIPASTDSVAMVTAVERYELPLVAGTEYTLSVQASHPEMAAVLFLFDTDGDTVSLSGTANALTTVLPAAPLTFVAPENIAGLYLQVQNRWRADQDGELSAALTFQEEDEQEPATGNVTELVDATGPWTSWGGDVNGVNYDDATGLITIDAPGADDGNRYGIQRFDTPLTAGTTYTLRTLNASDPGAGTLLFLFDESGTLISFAEPQSGETRSWIAASGDDVVSFTAPDGVTSFVVQVQSSWMATSPTQLTPSLQTTTQVVSCTPELSGIGEPEPMFPASTIAPAGEMSISANGRWSVFSSVGGDLIPGEPNPTRQNRIYLYDRQAGSVERILPATLLTTGTYENPVISADGSAVYFESNDGSVIDGIEEQLRSRSIFRYVHASRRIERAITAPTGSQLHLVNASADGQRVLVLADAASLIDETELDPSLASSRLVEYSFDTNALVARNFPRESSGSKVIASDDLAHVVYMTRSFPIFINGSFIRMADSNYLYRNILTGVSSIIAPANNSLVDQTIQTHDITADGRYVVFTGTYNPFSIGDAQFDGDAMYRWERNSGRIEEVVRGTLGTININSPRISDDGNLVAYRSGFSSPGSPLVIRAAVLDIATGQRQSLVTNSFGWPELSADGSAMLFPTQAAGLAQPVVSALQFDCSQ